MTLRESILNTFAKKETHQIVFSPRIYYWYLGNKIYSKRKSKISSNIPSHYYGKKQIDIYADLCASPRYSEETLYISLYDEIINSDANIELMRQKGSKPDETILLFKTPHGKLKQTESVGGGIGGHLTEYPIKSLEDIKTMQYILENTTFNFSKEKYEAADAQFGESCVTSTYLLKSPYQKLVTQFMGFTHTILFLKRYPSQMDNFIRFLEDWDDQMYYQIEKSPIEIINFGENLDSNLSPPHYFEKYHIPYYEKRVKQLHRVGKYCHIHIDGSLRDFLPYFAELPFDGLEALTAKPQGDVSLEEIKNSIGDKILLDGIPSILFLPQYKKSYLKKYTQTVLDLFFPNLILGVSDELSPNGDIRKIEMIAKMIQNFEA
ncbi:MAG: hypothetical protein KGD68_12185 [Candidatus Lokiarchaeota archaeon]|nr:hypothetical protein [Candidatus Lokiarchaeota archaeon]